MRRQINVRTNLPGIFKFVDWLPTGPYYLKPQFGHLGDPYCYRSTHLAKRLGMKNLYIGFSGYWPARSANLVFVYILQALLGQPTAPFIIASAGNTANSYNYYTHLTGLPIYLFVPESGLGNLLLPFETQPTLTAVDGDYTEAIILDSRRQSRAALWTHAR
jgi:cysteate synthase